MKQITYVLFLSVILVGCTTGKNENTTESKIFTIEYKCEGGAIVTVEYDNTQEESVAYVKLYPENPERIRMTISRSASGARYTDGKLVWWTKGNTAFLTDEEGDETIYSDCIEFR